MFRSTNKAALLLMLVTISGSRIWHRQWIDSEAIQTAVCKTRKLGASMEHKQTQTDLAPLEEYNEEDSSAKDYSPSSQDSSQGSPPVSPGRPSRSREWAGCEFSEGAGVMTSAGIYVAGLGVTASQHYDMEVSAVTFDQLQKVMKDEHENLTNEEKTEYEKKYAHGKAGVNTWFSWIVGNVDADGGWDSERKEGYSNMKKDTSVNHMLENIANYTNQKLHVYGDLHVESRDDWPINVYAYVRVVKFTFKSKSGETKSLNVIDSGKNRDPMKLMDDDGSPVSKDQAAITHSSMGLRRMDMNDGK